MRKLSLILASAMLVLSLAACGTEPASKQGSNNSEETTAERNLNSLTSNVEGAWYSDYINALMECKYKGKLEGYKNEVANATNEDAKQCHDSTVEYYAYQLMSYTDVGYDYISEELIAEYVELARDIMAKSSYTVHEGTLVGSDYQVKVDIQPINLNDLINDDVEAYIEQYNAMIDATDTSAYTDEQWDELENQYAEGVLAIIKGKVSQIGYKDTVSKIVIIEFDAEGRYGISDNDWYDIDDYVVDMK